MRTEVINKLADLITAAFGLIAALAWNDTIKAIFKSVFGSAETVSAMLIYAFIVTIIAVYATVRIGKAVQRARRV